MCYLQIGMCSTLQFLKIASKPNKEIKWECLLAMQWAYTYYVY